MIKALLVTGALAALVGGSATDCENGGSAYKAKVCVDRAHPVENELGNKTYNRVKDVQCENGTEGRVWRYYGGGIIMPGVGKQVPASGGSFDEPSNKYILVRIPEKGGTSANQEGPK